MTAELYARTEQATADAGTVVDTQKAMTLTAAIAHCRQALDIAMNAPCTVDRAALGVVVGVLDRRRPV